MEFAQLEKARYSLRKFSDRPVEPEKLALVLEAARCAPTAHNNQPQRILVLRSKEALALAAPQCAPAAGERCHRAEKLLEEGLGFADALRQGEALPPAACTLLALGIRSGSGDTVIREIARRLTEEGENALREKAERVEPALVLAASVLVGIILLAVMLPLLRVMSALG